MRLSILFLVGAAVFGASPGVCQQEADPAAKRVDVFWEGSLSAAFTRARRLGRPVMVALHGTKNRDTRRMLAAVYADSTVRALLKEMVCAVACKDAIAPIETGPRKGNSALFLTVTVAECQAIEAELRRRWLGDDAAVPQHVFLDAGGHLIERRTGFLTADALSKVLRTILDRVDPAWRPKADPAPSKAEAVSGGVPWSELFAEDVKQRKRAVRRLVATRDRELVVRMFRQIADVDTRAAVFYEARRVGGDKTWLGDLVRSGIADNETDLRAEAAVTAQYAADAALVPDLLVRLEKEKDKGVLSELVRATGACAHGDRKAIAALEDATRSRSDRVRGNAWIALAEASQHSPELAKRVAGQLVRKGLKDRGARSAAIWALGQIRAKSAKSSIEKFSKRERSRQMRNLVRDALKRLADENPRGWEDERRRIAKERVKR